MGTAGSFRIGAWVVVPSQNLIEGALHSVKLEPRTMDVLVQLARRPGDVVSVDELLSAVWQGVVVGEGSVYHAIKQLRQSLGSDDGVEYIETIPKRGYRLTVPVAELPARSEPRRWHRWATVVPVLAVVLLGAALTSRWRSTASEPADAGRTVTRFRIPVEDLAPFPSSVAVSPDGRFIAYVAGTEAAGTRLHVRARDAFESRTLAGTEGALWPFWSPDGQQIGFRVGSELRKVALVGGESEHIADLGTAPQGEFTWGPDGSILYDGGAGLLRVPAAGGAPTPETSLQAGEGSHSFPVFLPDGRHVVFSSGFKESGGVFLLARESGKRTRLSTAPGMAAYAAGRLLVHHLDGTLTTQPFDLDSGSLRGKPVQIATDVSGFSVSKNGVLAYTSGFRELMRKPVPPTQLTWYDRGGRRLGVVGVPGIYRGVALSRDGRHIAFHRHESLDDGEIGMIADTRTAAARLTRNRAHNFEPVWSPDGSQILYTGANFNLYRVRVSGDAPEKLALDSLRFAFASDWSRDGGTVLVSHVPPTTSQSDVAAFDVASGKVSVVLDGPFNEAAAMFSPDGRWIAYNSDESGRNEVYVREYPRGAGATRISLNGGWAPRWSGDGRSLFFIAADDKTLMVAGVTPKGRVMAAGPPRELFRADLPGRDHQSVIGPLFHFPYDVTPDGQRILVTELVGRPATAPRPANPDPPAGINVVVNWDAGLAQD